MNCRILLIGLTFVALTKFSYAQYIGQSSTQYNGSIYHLGGNLGIGTTTPNFSLTIRKDAAGAEGAVLNLVNSQYANSTGSSSAIRFQTGIDYRFAKISAIQRETGVTDRLAFGMVNYNDIYNEILTIKENGNVGIGTTEPSSILHLYKGGANDVRFKIEGTNNQYWRGVDFSYNGNTYGFIQHEVNFGELRISTGHSGWGGFQTFYTNGSEKMRILANGNVGIGTTTPRTRLSVSNSNNVFEINPGSTTTIEAIDLSNLSSSVNTAFYTRNGYFAFNTGSYQERLRIANDGYVGIGTTSPSSILHLHNQSLGTGRITLSSGAANAETYSIGQGIMGTSNGGFSIIDATNNVTRIAIQYITGNVGIGTTNPQYKLAVKGTIGCGEVKVEDVTNWPDFVFKPNYYLRPLSEVEQFIKTNNHLPEIPSEAEVKENGIGLGEMNAKLLQKVEELTLYLIEIKKENEELKNRVSKLENK